MHNKEIAEYGIRYEVKKINDSLYVLTPIDLIEGYCVSDTFYSKTLYKIIYGVESLTEQYLVDSIASVEFLKTMYEYDDLDFIKDYYLAEEKDYLIFVEVKDKELKKRKVNLAKLVKVESTETYERQKDAPAVTLNCDALDSLLSSISIQEIHAKLEEYRKKLKQFRDREKKESITSITVSNGHVSQVNLDKKVATQEASPAVISSKDTAYLLNGRPRDISEFTVRGLEQYLKERVFGHDEEIRKIATIMIMNYRAKPEYGAESILIAGPTGTGKTETGKAAAEYFNVPFVPVNTANLVPQGIKGPTLEDHLYALIIASNYKLERAERGFIFLDEFDKIGHDALDIKASVKQILLKFIEGDKFMIDKPSDDYVFNTRMLNKLFCGAFSDLFEEEKKQMGFGLNSEPKNPEFKPELIEKAQYFGKELITRIEHQFVYYPLSREDQRRIMLESKLSRLLMKKQRYEDEFNVELIALDSYIDAILDKLSAKDKSMRDLNNLILASLSEVEHALLETEGQVKKLVLSRDTVEDPHKFDLK